MSEPGNNSSQSLREALARFRRVAPAPLRVEPTNPFEVAVEQRLRHLEARIEEVKGRINGLFFTLVGAILVQLVLGLVK